MFMLCFISMFPLSYRHPKGKVNLNYVFIKPQSPSSVCDRKETGDDQIKLKQVPEGWRCVIVQVVRWWRCCAVWSFFLEFFLLLLLLLLFFFFFLVTMCGIFLYLEVISSLCCGEMFLILPGLIPLLPAIFIPIFITTQTLSSCYILFCLPITFFSAFPT